MKVKESKSKPAIHFYISEDCNLEQIVEPILNGMEEEGVPAIFKIKEEATSQYLGHKAADDSPLNVGIGIGKDKIVTLHEKKLGEKPLFKLPLIANEENLRAIGANGARLVKGVPFKKII